MSLGSSDMAGSALGTAFSLLFLASIIQGLPDVVVFHYKKMEAVVGQDVTLPCILNTSSNLKIVSIEWSMDRNEHTKLALYSPRFGHQKFWPNITLQIESQALGSRLHLTNVSKWDSGIYICDVATFPLGTIRRDTELEIKDVEIKCDANRTLEVQAGENVTIHCTALPNAKYRWTKNKKLVSENESLELLWVTDAHRGVYTLAVNTGSASLQKEFTITVLTATTSLRTDLMTVSASTNVTEEGLTESTTSSTTGPLITDTTVTWSMGTQVTQESPNPGNVTITPDHHVNYTHISAASSPAMHTDPYLLSNSTDQDTNTSNTSTFSDQSEASDLSTTASYGRTEFRSTQEMKNESTLQTVPAQFNSSTSPEGSITPKNTTKNPSSEVRNGVEDTDGTRSHLFLVLIIVPVLVLIVVAGFIYRKQIIKQRMDLPPPFKPPPPPVKYTSARRSEISTQQFPTDRCNSVSYEKRIIMPDMLHNDR